MKDSSLGDKTKKTFVEKIIQEMTFKNISFPVLADGVGENVNSIRAILYGNRKIDLDLAKRLCNYLQLDFYNMTKDDPILNSNKCITFGQKLAHYLDVNNLRQDDVANEIGVSRATISNIVHDKKSTNKDTLVNICGKYNLEFYDMVKDDPKYSEFSSNLNNKTSIMKLFNKVGINDPIPGYEDILTNLINENKELFLPKQNENFNNISNLEEN